MLLARAAPARHGGVGPQSSVRFRPKGAGARWRRIPDEVLELFEVVGTHDEIGRKIAERYGGLAGSLSLFIPTPNPAR